MSRAQESIVDILEPASINRTFICGSSVKRFASILPPAPAFDGVMSAFRRQDLSSSLDRTSNDDEVIAYLIRKLFWVVVYSLGGLGGQREQNDRSKRGKDGSVQSQLKELSH